MNMNLFVSIVVIVAGLYFLTKHTLGFIYFCIAGVAIYLLKGLIFTLTTAIIALIIFAIFASIIIYLLIKSRKEENPEKVDETFSIVFGLNKENMRSFITESLKVLSHQYLITDLVIDERHLDNPRIMNIDCYKGTRKVNVLNLIFEDDKVFIRSVNKVIDISRLLFCLKFNNNSFKADLSRSQQIYSNTLLGKD